MDKNSSNARFVADRITRLRIEHGISEYQLSLDLGFSKRSEERRVGKECAA